MEDFEGSFDDYTETTVDIGRLLPLFVAGVTTTLLFVPVILVSLRPAKADDENEDNENDEESDDDEHDNENGHFPPPTLNINATEKLNGNGIESAPLLPSGSSDSCGYGGTKTNTKSKWSLSRNNSLDSSPRKSVATSYSMEDFTDDEIGRLNAIRFSDPTTTALERLKIVTLYTCSGDAQTKAMLAIGLPYLLQAVVSAVSGFIQMAVVGYQLGTYALSAYVIIDLFIKLTSDAVGNVITSGNTMISQIAEAEDKNRSKKIGSYLQLSILFYIVGMVPIMIFWSFFTKDILSFLGIDSDMAEEGQRFARAYVLTILLDGVSTAFQETLDVLGFQVESTIMGFVGEVFSTTCIIVVMCCHSLFPNISLSLMGWTYVFVDLIYMSAMLFVIHTKGWFDEYYEGFFSNPISIFSTRTATNSNSISEDTNGVTNGGNNEDTTNNTGASKAAVKLMISNTIQYAIANFLFEAEWHILLLFASSLGSAEVAAWGVLGIIWEELEYIVSAISDGCEVRVALTLGKGDVKAAKLIAYKAIWISLVWGMFVSVVFMLFEDEIPRLITDDSLLQKLVSFNLPMIALANLVSGIAIMAEHVLWCQNRAKLATAISTGTSLITLPLAGLSSCLFRFNLIGQTAAVAIGAASFAALSMYFVITSDWKQISKDVIALHGDDDDSSESSSSSEESSSSSSESESEPESESEDEE